MGLELYSLARGIDDRTVQSNRSRKSLSNERTFHQDFTNLEGCIEQIPDLYEELLSDLDNKSLGSTDITKVFIKLKFSDFSTTTAEKIKEQNFQQKRIMSS